MGDADKEAASIQAHLADGQIHGKNHAVLAPTRYLSPDSDDLFDAGPEVGGKVAVVSLPVGRGHQHLDVLPERLILAVAEQPLGARREQLDRAAFVDDDNAVGNGVEDAAKLRFAIAGSHIAGRSAFPELQQRWASVFLPQPL